MPSLQVRELPDNIYRLLLEKSTIKHRSLAQEAIMTLAKGLETNTSNKDRRNKILAAITDQPCNAGPKAANLDPVSLQREDRER